MPVRVMSSDPGTHESQGCDRRDCYDAGIDRVFLVSFQVFLGATCHDMVDCGTTVPVASFDAPRPRQFLELD